MRNIIYRILQAIVVLAVASSFAHADSFMYFKKKAAGSLPNPAEGNTMHENFETATTGYENIWTTSASAPNPVAVVPGSPFVNLGSQSFSAQKVGTTQQWAAWDYGSYNTATKYVRFYFYVSSESIADTDYDEIFNLSEQQTTSVMGRIRLGKAGTQLYLKGYGTGSPSSAVNISTATWYRVESMFIYNDAGTGCELKVFDSVGQVGSTVTFAGAAGSITLRHFRIGGISTSSNNFIAYFDAFSISTIGYIGQ